MALETIALRALAWCWTYCVHSTLLLAGAWFVARRIDPRALAVRERLWKTALWGGLATAALQSACFEHVPSPLGALGLEWTQPRQPSAGEPSSAPGLVRGGAAGFEPSRAECRSGAEEMPAGTLCAPTAPTSAQPSAQMPGCQLPGRGPVGTAPAAVAHARAAVPAEASAAEPRCEFVGAQTPATPGQVAEPEGQGACATPFGPSWPAAVRSGAARACAAARRAPNTVMAALARAIAAPIANLGAERAQDGASAAPARAAALATTQPASAPQARPAPTTGASFVGASRAVSSRAGERASRSPRALAWLCLVALLAASAACATWLALGGRTLARQLRRRREVAEGPLREAFEQLRSAFGLDESVRLYTAPHLEAPLCTGLARAAVYVPERAVDGLAPDEQRAMLAHELAHVARRDPAWLCASWVLQTLFFFQPLNRLVRRELVRSFEWSADAWAVRATGDHLALASCLARIGEWLLGARRARPPAPHAAAMARALSGPRASSHLGVRIERLLDETALVRALEARRARGSEVALAALVLAGTAWAVPGARVSQADTNERASEGTPPGAAAPDTASQAAQAELVAVRATPAPRHGPDAGSIGTEVTASAREAPSSAAPARAALEDVFGTLDDELRALEGDVLTLGEQLRDQRADPEWSLRMEVLETRAQRLRGQRERLQALLEVARTLDSVSKGAPPSPNR